MLSQPERVRRVAEHEGCLAERSQDEVRILIPSLDGKAWPPIAALGLEPLSDQCVIRMSTDGRLSFEVCYGSPGQLLLHVLINVLLAVSALSAKRSELRPLGFLIIAAFANGLPYLFSLISVLRFRTRMLDRLSRS